MKIKKVAILGAGVMGAQIAAQTLNAGIETLLFDLSSSTGNPNSIVDKAIANLLKLKPDPLATSNLASKLQAKSYDKDLEELLSCDLIIEAIAERLDLKEDLYKRIKDFINPDALLVTNTSGLSITKLSTVLPTNLRARFCGVHFFNPPRYMHLVELIPIKENPKLMLDELETWLTRYLGKGVIRAFDTPNFIANRLGVFSLLTTMHHAEAMGLGLDEVDALTGSLIGRPKSATFRTMDVVGLDTMQHVVKTMWDNLADDPWHELFILPTWLKSLIEAGHLGQKSGKGIYLKQPKGLEVFDIKLKSYRPVEVKLSKEVTAIFAEKDYAKRIKALNLSTDKQAQFLAACFRDLWQYAAYHLASIAKSVRDVDLALRFGFGWDEGPFELWQRAGVANVLSFIKQDKTQPTWLNADLEFYTEEGAYSPSLNSYLPSSKLAVYQRQIYLPTLPYVKEPNFPTLFENSALKLVVLEDDIAMLTFKTKANTINQELIEGMQKALDLTESSSQGLIIHQKSAQNFSSGADLRLVASLISELRFADLEAVLSQFQNLVMRIKYSAIPVIAAVRGRALGGGCELALHSANITAAFEAYLGLVEIGVGLIPAGGGCKELALRAAETSEIFTSIQAYFQLIATAKISSSAKDAQEQGFLRQTDNWLMHSNEVLFVAHAKIKALQAANYQPPLAAKFKIAGREGFARIKAGLVNWREGFFISEHDFLIAEKLAFILCGGDLYEGEIVDEAWLLKLEREAFIELAKTPATQARIKQMLETGKPLRN